MNETLRIQVQEKITRENTKFAEVISIVFDVQDVIEVDVAVKL